MRANLRLANFALSLALVAILAKHLTTSREFFAQAFEPLAHSGGGKPLAIPADCAEKTGVLLHLNFKRYGSYAESPEPHFEVADPSALLRRVREAARMKCDSAAIESPRLRGALEDLARDCPIDDAIHSHDCLADALRVRFAAAGASFARGSAHDHERMEKVLARLQEKTK